MSRYKDYGKGAEKDLHMPLSRRHREHALRHPNCKRSQELVRDLAKLMEDYS